MINAETGSRRDAEIAENLLSQQILDAAIEAYRIWTGTSYRWMGKSG